MPNEISASGRSKIGSQTVRIRLECVDAGAGRHPARLDVQLGDAPVVAAEEGEEVLGQVALVGRAQRAHDAEVDRDVVALRGDEDVPRMHVGVEEAVAEHLREEDLDTVLGDPLEVDAGGAHRRQVADRDAADALHDHHVAVGQRPVHLGDVEQLAALEGAAQLRGVGRLAQQVELVEEDPFRLGHHLDRAQAACILPVALGQLGDQLEQADVVADGALDARAQHLDHHLAAVLELRGVHLGDRRRGQRGLVETAEQLGNRPAEGFLDRGARHRAGEWRHAVLQLGQLGGDVVG